MRAISEIVKGLLTLIDHKLHQLVTLSQVVVALPEMLWSSSCLAGRGGVSCTICEDAFRDMSE
jgi:hypothetical protein